jgi:hypothetical protein
MATEALQLVQEQDRQRAAAQFSARMRRARTVPLQAHETTGATILVP